MLLEEPRSGILRPRMSSDPAAATGQALSPEEFRPVPRTGTVVQSLTRPSLSYWQDAWIRLRKNGQATVSLGIIVFLLAFTAVGPLFWRVDPTEQNLSRISESPSFGARAVVLPELDDFQDITVTAPDKPVVKLAAELGAPGHLRFIGVPSTQAVRLQWDAVEGATSYAIYRSDRKPAGRSDVGIPIGETDSGFKVSYEDRFDLKPETYYYTVVPKGAPAMDPKAAAADGTDGVEADRFATIEAALPISITLADAQKLKPDVALAPANQPPATLDLPAHPLGTDYLGRDLLARLMVGARVSLFIGLFAPFVWTLLGVILGGISGYFGGKTDEVLMRVTDFVLALPFILFAILFRVAMGTASGDGGITPMMLAMITLLWTNPARLVRGEVLRLREAEFVQASKLLGAKPMYLIVRHLLPNTMGVILVSVTFSIPYAIFTEAFLSFIGMGVVPPTPSWGSMCNDGIKTFLTHPHEFLFPAIFISLAVLAFNLLGDGLRDALDPRMRSV